MSSAAGPLLSIDAATAGFIAALLVASACALGVLVRDLLARPPARDRTEEPLRLRLARLRASWSYKYFLGTPQVDLRTPVDAAVATDRLRVKRAYARHWLDASRARRMKAAKVVQLQPASRAR